MSLSVMTNSMAVPHTHTVQNTIYVFFKSLWSEVVHQHRHTTQFKNTFLCLLTHSAAVCGCFNFLLFVTCLNHCQTIFYRYVTLCLNLIRHHITYTVSVRHAPKMQQFLRYFYICIHLIISPI